MRIAVFNGSPRKENTYAMIQAFREGAEAAGHEVEEYHVGKMKIAGCMGCMYCKTKGEGGCIQKDDLEKIMPAYKEADMIVFARLFRSVNPMVRSTGSENAMPCPALSRPAAS